LSGIFTPSISPQHGCGGGYFGGLNKRRNP
jgi:hypothetical protein